MWPEGEPPQIRVGDARRGAHRRARRPARSGAPKRPALRLRMAARWRIANPQVRHLKPERCAATAIHDSLMPGPAPSVVGCSCGWTTLSELRWSSIIYQVGLSMTGSLQTTTTSAGFGRGSVERSGVRRHKHQVAQRRRQRQVPREGIVHLAMGSLHNWPLLGWRQLA